MPIRTVMLDLVDDDAADPLLSVALPLAARHEATLVGLSAPTAPPLMTDLFVGGGYVAPGGRAEALVEEHRRRTMERDAETARRFEATLARAGARGALERIEAGPEGLGAAVVRACRNADLVMALQRRSGSTMVSPETLALDCGRPVLVVPNQGRYAEVGRRALIAWNGSREAARAAFDALPLLAPGAAVQVLAVDAGQVDPGRGFQPGDTLARTLSRHGFSVEAIAAPLRARTVGDEILNRAADFGADLIIMGCYGHSRLRELVFGGATRSILGQITVPTLLSH